MTALVSLQGLLFKPKLQNLKKSKEEEEERKRREERGRRLIKPNPSPNF
jgi:hypothetical protein